MHEDTIDGLFAFRQTDDPLDVERAFARFARDVLGQSAPAVALQRYELRRTLGSGGAGVVYEAFDPELERAVAIKVMHPGRGDDQSDRQRLVREAKALARLSHPNVVQIHDVGRYERPDATGGVFIVMELVSGRTLAQHIIAGDDWRTMRPRLLQAGRGLQAAHGIGLVHRDFKPGNVVVGDDGRVRVVDFGLARSSATTLDTETAAESRSEPLTATLTRTGTVTGTPAYMAPEQHRGEAGDARTDQFAFAVVAFEALHGRRPHEGDTLAALYRSKIAGPSPTPRGSVPAYVRRALHRGLAPEPDDRFASMADLLEALEGRAHRRRLWLGAGVGAVGLAATIFGARGIQEEIACTDVAAELGGAWDEPRREALRGALTRVGDEALAGRIEARVDRYVERWLDARRQTCEDEWAQRHEPDPRAAAACLDRSRSAVAAAVDLLQREPDVQLAMRSIDMLDGLPAPASCRDPRRLRREPPAPESEAIRTRVDAVRRALAELTVLRRAGRYEDVRARIERARGEAERLEYAPLSAEVDLAEGLLLKSDGKRLADAAELLERAYLHAERIDHRWVAADAAIELVHVVGHRLERPGEGFQWAKLARAAIDEEDFLRRVRLDTHRAFLFTTVDRRDYDQAVRLLEQTHAAVRARAPERRDLQGTLLHNTALMLMRAKRFEEAAPVMADALAIKIEHYGAGHPKVARAHLIHGVMRDRMGDIVGAEQAFARGVRALESQRATSSLRESLLDNLGSVRIRQRRWDEAEAALDQRLAVADAKPQIDDDRRSLVRSLCMRVEIDLHAGELDGARRRLDRAAAVAEPLDGAMGLVALYRAQLRRQEGDAAGALRDYEEAVRRLERDPLAPRGTLTRARVRLAEAGLELDPPRDVRALAEQAMASLAERTIAKQDLAGREQRARVRWALARTIGARDPALARELAREAHGELEALGMTEWVAVIEDWRRSTASRGRLRERTRSAWFTIAPR